METTETEGAEHPSYESAWFSAIPAAAKKMLYLRGIMFYDASVSSVEGPRNDFRVDYPRGNGRSITGFLRLAANPWFNTR